MHQADQSIAAATAETEARKPYARPVLTCFGSIAELTRGNSGSGPDGNGRKPPGQG
jgi:hypothetical protein